MLFEKTSHQGALADYFTCSESSTVFKSIEVSFDAENQLLLVNWEGQSTSEEIRKGYDVMMEQVRSHIPKRLCWISIKGTLLGEVISDGCFLRFFRRSCRQLGIMYLWPLCYRLYSILGWW